MELSGILFDLIVVSLFMVLGMVIRARVKILQRFMLPASVIGGIIGLILGKNVLGVIPMSGFYSQLANVAIDVVFAGLFIGKVIPKLKSLGKTAGAQTAYAYFNSFGQVAIGLGVVVLFGFMGTRLHPAFGLGLITGFQGGVGVGTATAPMMASLGWDAAESAAISETCAIVGLVMSVLMGIIIINIGIAKNWTTRKLGGENKQIENTTFIPSGKRTPIGEEVTSPDAGSSLVYNFGIMGLAIFCGYLIHYGIITAVPMLKFMPKFPFVLIGGLIVQSIIQRARLDSYIDKGTVDSISGFALDAMIVASLMAINLSVIIKYAVPLTVMLIAGLTFNYWQVRWMGPRVLSEAWFEKSVCEFGQSTGATPQALLLLKIMDPRLETGAAEAFAMKMFFLSPIMFPAILMLMPSITAKGALPFLLIFLGLMLLVLVICRITCWNTRGGGELEEQPVLGTK